VLTIVYDHGTRRSHLLVLDAEHVEDGPVAAMYLEHHLPHSFHGSFFPG